MINRRKIIFVVRSNPIKTLLCCLLVLAIVYIITTHNGSGSKFQRSNAERTRPLDCFLAVIIMTGPKNFDRRNAIRRTWAPTIEQKQHGYSEMRYYFVIGRKNLPQGEMNQLTSENDKFNDLLFLNDLEDSYEKLSTKLGLTCEWLGKNLKFAFMLKVDDDSFVRLDKIQWDLKMDPYKYVPNLYWGYFYGRSHVKQSGKWKETNWKLCDYYLPYARGGGYVISADLVKFVGSNWRQFEVYLSEDVTMGAWLAPFRLKRVHDTRFDTEYKSRGCKNHFIVSHKQSIEDMEEKHKNLQESGKICKEETNVMNGYEYNWGGPPSQCCVRDAKIP